MARPVWSQRRKARYGAKTFIQSHQYSGCSAEETSCEHVGLAVEDAGEEDIEQQIAVIGKTTLSTWFVAVI